MKVMEGTEPTIKVPEMKKELEAGPEVKEDDSLTKVKFTESMPQFVGEDFNEYGPFKSGDEAELPPQITDILMNKGVIQKV